MRFEWSEEKNKSNLRKHGVGFDVAQLVFDDPFAITQRDIVHEDEEERFLTLGSIGQGAVLLVVHLSFEDPDSDLVTRIISARAASAREKRNYEEAHKKATKRDRRSRRKEGQGY